MKRAQVISLLAIALTALTGLLLLPQACKPQVAKKEIRNP